MVKRPSLSPADAKVSSSALISCLPKGRLVVDQGLRIPPSSKAAELVLFVRKLFVSLIKRKCFMTRMLAIRIDSN